MFCRTIAYFTTLAPQRVARSIQEASPCPRPAFANASGRDLLSTPYFGSVGGGGPAVLRSVYPWPVDAQTAALIASAAATAALVIVGGGALVANVYQARQTRRAVDAAIAETGAAVRQAAASEHLAAEAQRNRELDWQPTPNRQVYCASLH
jgi:hypothetical protein